MTSCVAVEAGCKDCNLGPVEPDHRCDDLCRMLASQLAKQEFHAAWHRALQRRADKIKER